MWLIGHMDSAGLRVNHSAVGSCDTLSHLQDVAEVWSGCCAAGYADKTKVKVNRLLGQLRGALLRAGDLASCEQIRRARVPILKVGRL